MIWIRAIKLFPSVGAGALLGLPPEQPSVDGP
jgi:hypothetical protein